MSSSKSSSKSPSTPRSSRKDASQPASRAPEDRAPENRAPEDLVDFELNGLSIHMLSVNQAGDLEVEFDLPHEQGSTRWQTTLRASRTFDIYEDRKLAAACNALFALVRERVLEPDAEREAIHCDSCKTSACCRKYNVLVKRSDVDRLARGLGRPKKEIVSEYLTIGVDWCGDYPYQLGADEDDEGEEKCVFLKLDAKKRWRCSIYEHRPDICRAFDMKTCDDFIPIEKVRRIS